VRTAGPARHAMFTDTSHIRAAGALRRAYRRSVTTHDETSAAAATTRPVGGTPWDCPECGVTASVHDDVCDVCFAELDEFRLDPWDEYQ